MVGLSVASRFFVAGPSVAPRFSYGRTLRGSPLLVWLDCQSPPGFRRVGLLEALGFLMVGLIVPSGFRMEGLSEVSRYSCGCTLKGPPEFRIDRLLEVPRIRMVGLLDALHYSYGWTLRGPLVFVWLDA